MIDSVREMSSLSQSIPPGSEAKNDDKFAKNLGVRYDVKF